MHRLGLYSLLDHKKAINQIWISEQFLIQKNKNKYEFDFFLNKLRKKKKEKIQWTLFVFIFKDKGFSHYHNIVVSFLTCNFHMAYLQQTLTLNVLCDLLWSAIINPQKSTGCKKLTLFLWACILFPSFFLIKCIVFICKRWYCQK